MGCGTRRVKVDDLRPEQKWDFISMNDFKSTSCLEPFAYGYLWLSLIISTAVYTVDTFTAVNLLAFNRWSGEIKPYIPLDVSKWIFSGCIIASWVNLAFEHLRALRVMRRGAVAESYLDNLAVRLECIKMGKSGRGWRRFLVFAELTKSKKGVEYVALFTYFSFQSWIRVIFCQGPRQVINALTLWSVFQAKLDPTDASDVGDSLVSFFKNIEILAEAQHQQAVVLSGMVFTLVIWVFSALSLILAILFYLLFLWHYLPTADGGLTGFCERKINGRLSKIVSVKVNKAIEEEERRRLKAEARAAKKGEKVSGRQATLPTFLDSKDDNKLPDMPMLNRQDTMSTLPLYTSRPGTPSSNVPQVASFELDKLEQQRTQTPGTNFAANASLVNNAGAMGFSRIGSPAPPNPNNGGIIPGPQQTSTAGSQSSQWQRGPPQGPARILSPMGPNRDFTASPMSYSTEGRNTPGFPGQQRQNAVDQFGRPIPRAVAEMRSNTPMGPPPSMGRRTPFDQNMQSPQDRMMSPAPGSEYGRGSPFNPNMQNPQNRMMSPGPGSEYGRPAFNPGYQNQGRSSPAPGQGPSRPFDPSLQNQGRSSPAPLPAINTGAYKPYNPNPEPEHEPSPVSEVSAHSLGSHSQVSSAPTTTAPGRNYTEPIPRAHYGSGGEYEDQEMVMPRRSNTGGNAQQGHGQGLGSDGSGSSQWGGAYR